MANEIFEILTSKEIIVITILLIIIVIIMNPINKFLKKNNKNRKNQKNESKNEFTSKSKEPGKIIVPDSTYEILMKEKKKRK